MVVLGVGSVAAQTIDADSAQRQASPIVLADTSFFPPTVAFSTSDSFRPLQEVEESEPGSFLLGAFVGLIVAAAILSEVADQGDGGGGFFILPIGVIGGGMIFWSAGIG
jgi:hypothetical protein